MSKVASLLDIPWFAFDVPKYGTLDSEVTNQRQPIFASNTTDFALTGWESSPTLPGQPSLPVSKQPARLKTLRHAQTTPVVEFAFKHCDDIRQYMRAYRAYHTHKQTGVYGLYHTIHGPSPSPANSEPEEANHTKPDENIVLCRVDTNRPDDALKQTEILHILRHSQSRRAKGLGLSKPGAQEEEGEDNHNGMADTRRRQTKIGKLLDRPNSSSSINSVSSSEKGFVRTASISLWESKSLSAGMERQLQHNKLRSERDRLRSECDRLRSKHDRLRSECDIASNKHSSRQMPQIVPKSRYYNRAPSSVYPTPGSRFFVGSTLRRSPQKGLSAESSLRYRNRSSQLHASRSTKLLNSTHYTISALKQQEYCTPLFPKMGCNAPFKRPMLCTPAKPKLTTQERLSIDLGLEYDDNNGYGSLSSGDEENDVPQTTSPSVPSVKYQALKRQMKQLSDERESLLLKISKLKDKTKQHERQLNKEESDRKNQLNIMKNTHEQAFSDKNKMIQLFESLVRDQECELEELRKITYSEGLGTCVDYPPSQSSTAVTRLTTHLNQVIQEKNDILAQFFSQQSLIKEQQSELKDLLRCKAENNDLQAQISALNRSLANANKQNDSHQNKLKQSEQELASVKTELESLRVTPQTSLSKQAVQKLEEQNTKLQDKLLRKEVEFMEMDLHHRETTQKIADLSTEKDQEIRQLKLDVFRHKSHSQTIVERIREVPVESEAAKKALTAAQAEIKSLTSTISQLKSDHETAAKAAQALHGKMISQLENDLAKSRRDYDTFTNALKSREDRELQNTENQKGVVAELERQIKQKKLEMGKLRQDMANKVVELEQKRDTDLEDLELRLQQSMQDTTRENRHLRDELSTTLPQITRLKQDCLHLKRLYHDMQQVYTAECINIGKQLNQAIHDVTEQNIDLVRKYKKEMALRKKYHNELVVLKGNIRVFCRVRPIISEDGKSPHTVLNADADDEDVLVVENNKGRCQSFEMDRLFTPKVSQQQVFDEVKALVTSCIDGYHVCIFAYGQTGSGKTYTMEGQSSDPGINQRALAQLFEEAGERAKDWTFHLKVSVMEIYNESVRDLLSSEPSDKLDIKLNQDGNLHVPGLSWVVVNNVADVNRTFAIGHKNRATASTNMNEHSSRSHALLCVEVTGQNRTTGAKTLGKLNLVDLAGSERVSKSGADGARLKEAQAINKSLSALGDVIAALRSKQNFVPYRNSKLTYLLQDSLGGDSKVLMIVQVAPVENHVNETLCSLNFAQRVRSVELGMASKKMENAEITALKGRLAHYEGSGSPLSTPTKSSTHLPGTPLRRKP